VVSRFLLLIFNYFWHIFDYKLRVLQVITRFDFGGAENYVRELSNELSEQGIEVYIFSKQGRQNNLLNPKIHFFNAVLSSKFILFKAINIVLLVKKRKIEVIHAHQRLPIISASIASLITGKPLVVTVHGRVRYDLRSRISRKVPSCFIFVSNKVLTVSKYFKQIETKSVVIPNGIPNSTKKYKHIPYQIGYISRLDTKHAKVIYQLITIFPKLSHEFKGISLSIIGDGEEIDNIKWIANNTNKYLGYDAIQVHGYIENLQSIENVPELILGVGRVAIESAIKGCSVISINSKRMGHLVTLENYEFYKENNFVNTNGVPPTEDSLHNEISNFFINRELYRIKSIDLAKKLHTDFDITVVAKKISDIYIKATNH